MRAAVSTTRVPNRLWLSRHRRGLGQKTMARALEHKDRGQFSRYETGLVIPSLPVALRLQRFFGTPVATLFDGLYDQESAALDDLIAKDELLARAVDPDLDDQCAYDAYARIPELGSAEVEKVRAHAERWAECVACPTP